jgi:hypothetical protein
MELFEKGDLMDLIEKSKGYSEKAAACLMT